MVWKCYSRVSAASKIVPWLLVTVPRRINYKHALRKQILAAVRMQNQIQAMSKASGKIGGEFGRQWCT
jgi:hypothetical protein